ncbi:hypothetical protein M0R45_024566 [Rubus argutus]
MAVKGAKPEPPTDEDGHGTHTASTAGGAFVQNADALGQPKAQQLGWHLMLTWQYTKSALENPVQRVIS